MTTSYWDHRYAIGGNSGAGSYGKLADYKARVINDFVAENKVDHLIDMGCGDGNQLALFRVDRYTGIDTSKVAIEMLQEKYAGDKKKLFATKAGYQKAPLALSMDVIFHLTDDEQFERYMKALFNASRKYVIIYSSNGDKLKHTGGHMIDRRFTDWVKENRPDFTLTKVLENEYPFDPGKSESTSISDFYFFEKQ